MSKKYYKPLDGVSQALLESVRQKVKANVLLLENVDHDSGTIDNLSWLFANEEGTISLCQNTAEVRIVWDASEIAGSDPRFENIVNNMQFFVDLETKIYRILENAYEMQEANKTQ